MLSQLTCKDRGSFGKPQSISPITALTVRLTWWICYSPLVKLQHSLISCPWATSVGSNWSACTVSQSRIEHVCSPNLSMRHQRRRTSRELKAFSVLQAQTEREFNSTFSFWKTKIWPLHRATTSPIKLIHGGTFYTMTNWNETLAGRLTNCD